MVPRKNGNLPFLFLCIAVATAAPDLTGATLCVNQGGTGGCFSKISNAVSAANTNDTVKVAAGTYKENVIIGKSISLVGAGQTSTIIDAAGLANGVYIDGLDNAGLHDVLVRDFTILNAKFEGILIANASGVTIVDNAVLNNNKSLVSSSATCPGIPAFETSEGQDCGEGIHLLGVDHSLVSNNLVANNSGGILLSDDTAATHDNLISQNDVTENGFACGITMASHPPIGYPTTAPFGVFHNTVFANDSSRNGLGAPGAGAGVGIFASVPGAASYGNVVVSNTLTRNGLPGVTMHSHTPGQTLTDNMIVGNTISGNAADTEDAATAGPAGINVFGVSPVSGTVIAQNVISNENVDVSVNTPVEVRLHLNSLLGKEIGVDNVGAGSVDAINNWWGCVAGPTARACSNAGGPGVTVTPFLTAPF